MELAYNLFYLAVLALIVGLAAYLWRSGRPTAKDDPEVPLVMSNPSLYMQELQRYAAVLEQQIRATHHGGDRDLYSIHSAAVGQMRDAINRRDLKLLKEIVARERRSFGWSYIAGEGETDAAFHRFATLVEEGRK